MSQYKPDPKVIAAARRAAKRKGATPVERKAGFAATLVETGGKNLNYGDKDSVGALQQRPSQGWHGLTNPTKAFEEFFDAARAELKKNPGLNSAQLAQAVQRSAFGDRYAAKDVQSMAQKLLNGGSAGSRSADPQYQLTGGDMKFSAKQTPATDVPSRRVAALMALGSGAKGLPKLGSSKLKQADYLFRTGQAVERVPGQYTSKITTTPTKVTVTGNEGGGSAGGKGRFKIEGPNPKRVAAPVRSFGEKVAAEFGEGLIASDGSTHSKFTVNGNVSDHWSGHAVDIFKTADGTPMKGTTLLHAGQAALIAAGMPRKEALQKKGGLYNVNGHQVIFLTMEGGNHYDHLHISAY